MDASRGRKERLRRLSRWLSSKELQAAVFLKEDIEKNGYNYVYYGGSFASEEYSAIIVDSSAGSSSIVQEHSYERVKASGKFDDVISTRQSTDELVLHLKEALRAFSPQKVVVDGSTATAGIANLIEERVRVRSDSSLTAYAYDERSRKSEYEVNEIEKAIAIGKRALKKTVSSFRAGQNVADITRRLKKAMLEEGAVSESFATNVVILDGVSERSLGRLKRGSLVLFDFGARLESEYLSDMGRTVAYGATKATRDFLEVVFQIKRDGLREIKSGRSGSEVRERIDKIIAELGFASVHRPGHQIGLNVHEPYEPNLAYGKENEKPLEKANVVTWEPGIGLKEKLGKVSFGLAHMEDMVLVGDNSKMLGGVPLDFA